MFWWKYLLLRGLVRIFTLFWDLRLSVLGLHGIAFCILEHRNTLDHKLWWWSADVSICSKTMRSTELVECSTAVMLVNGLLIESLGVKSAAWSHSSGMSGCWSDELSRRNGGIMFEPQACLVWPRIEHWDLTNSPFRDGVSFTSNDGSWWQPVGDLCRFSDSCCCRKKSWNIRGFLKGGYGKMDGYFWKDNPFQMDGLGVPPLSEPTISILDHVLAKL